MPVLPTFLPTSNEWLWELSTYGFAVILALGILYAIDQYFKK